MPAKHHGIWREINKLKAEDKVACYSPVKIKAPVLVDWGAAMHMLSSKDLRFDEVDTSRRSRNPTTVVTAYGEVQTSWEAQMYFHDLDLFVTMQLLEEPPAVLSLGKLCSEHGCSYEWKNCETPRFTPPKKGKTITCIMDNFVLLSHQDCHHLPAAARLPHQDQKISQHLLVNPKHQQIQ